LLLPLNASQTNNQNEASCDPTERSKNAARHSLEAVSANPDDTTKPLQLGNIQCHIHFALSGRIAIKQTTPKLLLCQHSRGEYAVQQNTAYRLSMPTHKTYQKLNVAQLAQSSTCAFLGSGAKHAACSAQHACAAYQCSATHLLNQAAVVVNDGSLEQVHPEQPQEEADCHNVQPCPGVVPQLWLLINSCNTCISKARATKESGQ